jgi:formamidopyrimidine-DNA glycosylase
MPELPEVETVRRGLLTHAAGGIVQSIQQMHPRALSPKSISGLEAIVGAQLLDIQRRGKFLWFVLDRPFTLAAHLGMSGQFLINPKDHRHTRAILTLRHGKKISELHFNDQRTCGGLSVEELKNGVPSCVEKIALDLFDENFDQKKVIEKINTRSISIKTAILNQNILSGIGNIYADESLWAARIHPESKSNAITPKEIERVIESAKEVMARAIEVGGTSFDELYINVNGESGYFDISLNAYGRENEPCPRCGTLIRRIKFANRSSHFCPRCQIRQVTSRNS